jgi:predicted metal-dependent HD superfamily phosphohydrolase
MTEAAKELIRAPLRARFMQMCYLLAPKADQRLVVGWFDVLVGLYGQPHRAYHTIDHVRDLLSRLDAFENFLPRAYRLEVEVGIWFHDAIYRVPSARNEVDSAALAESFLITLGIDGRRSPFGNSVLSAIEATKYDGSSPPVDAAAALCDLDLAGFADPWDKFEENNRKIRREYAIYTDEQYRWGRVKFLSGLLGRPIFNVLTDLEIAARANIERHVGDLVRGGPVPA